MPRNHDDWLKAYVDLLTPKGEAPERFHFWVGVSTVAGVLRRRTYIDMGNFRWYPNFFIILVGPPGLVKKSTTINIGAQLLRDMPRPLGSEHPSVILGADCSTWESFVEEVANAKDYFAEGDQSQADILDQTATVTCALTLAISEFGTFFDPNNRSMVNILTEFYDGKVNSAFIKRTKTQGSDVVMNPFVNLVAGTTPKWMHDNFRGQFGGWGLSSRMIFLHCDERERLVPYADELWRGLYDSTMKSFLEDLSEIAKLQGVVELTPEARDLGRKWYKAHDIRQTAINKHAYHDPWLSYYLARKFDHIHKLATVLSASRRSSLEITVSDLRDAIARCDEIEGELSKVFAGGRETQAARLNMDVWSGLENMITEQGRIDQPHLFAFTGRYMAYGPAKDLINQLIGSKWLVAEADPTGTWYSFGPNAVRKERPAGETAT